MEFIALDVEPAILKVAELGIFGIPKSAET
jgi:hypothetical protein